MPLPTRMRLMLSCIKPYSRLLNFIDNITVYKWGSGYSGYSGFSRLPDFCRKCDFGKSTENRFERAKKSQFSSSILVVVVVVDVVVVVVFVVVVVNGVVVVVVLLFLLHKIFSICRQFDNSPRKEKRRRRRRRSNLPAPFFLTVQVSIFLLVRQGAKTQLIWVSPPY